ncbi:uncharacterized protein [Palaemon carinicauda]|uniref:uncharacterized protein n=1 Tax=Palaemon carinicauda TaxID=392227 RepID=UPI0035B6621D
MDSRIGTFPQFQCRFAHIHIDVVCPLPTSQEHGYLLTVIDHPTRWPEALTTQTVTSASWTSTLLSEWIATFGIPEHITSDKNTTLPSQLWTSLVNLLGVTLHQTTAYNPTDKRTVEQFNHPQSSSHIPQ